MHDLRKSDVAESEFRFSFRDIFVAPVIVGALGYFVDIYDLVLFSIVRVASLKELGLEGQSLLDVGVSLISLQMVGMLLGGIFWGVLGDKKGRISVLFGSIALYSAANLLNAFVTNTTQYGILRFVAGVGLAGELGAAITLVSEALPRKIRGYGTTLVAAIGICGAVFGGIVNEFFHWRTSYLIGGVLGLLLLVLRIRLKESGMFSQTSTDNRVKKGDLRMLFAVRARATRYLQCISIGLPVWFAVGVLLTFAPELGEALKLAEPVTGAKAILFGYAGLSLGDLFSGILSQRLRSRKAAIAIFLLATALFTGVYGISGGASAIQFYFICFSVGLGIGYWALFVAITAEQFGTNLRATVAISAPNFVRGAVVPLTFAFRELAKPFGLVPSAMMVGAASLLIAIVALIWMDETFGKDLDYLEIDSA